MKIITTEIKNFYFGTLLPMKARIIYKICLLTYKALKFGEPKYLYEYLFPFELETSVTVRHASDRHRLFEPRTNHCSGERSFQYRAPRLGYITKYQWKSKIAKTLPNLRKD